MIGVLFYNASIHSKSFTVYSVHEENPVTNSEAIECLSKLRSHFQSLGGTPETFQGIQHMEKILFKNKMEESSKQTKITDAFSVNQLILRE